MAAVVTAKGRDIITSILTSPSGVPAVLGWGLNPNGLTSSVSDVALFQEAPETRISGGTVTVSVITTTTANDTVQIQGTIVCGATGETISEVMVVDATTKPFSGTISSNAGSTIIGSATATGLVVAGGYHGTLPSSGAYLQLDTGEVVEITSGAGTSGTPYVVTRAANGSGANANAASGTNITLGAAPGTSVPGANVLLHADFSGLALTPGQSIQFTVQIKAN